MNDYIKREDAIKAVDAERHQKHLFNTAEDGLLEARCIIATLPSADVVERKRGEWIEHKWIDENWELGDIPKHSFECNVCHCIQYFVEATNFCPNCGADMRTEQTEPQTEREDE